MSFESFFEDRERLGCPDGGGKLVPPFGGKVREKFGTRTTLEPGEQGRS